MQDPAGVRARESEQVVLNGYVLEVFLITAVGNDDLVTE
jgi:hypothetical protein